MPKAITDFNAKVTLLSGNLWDTKEENLNYEKNNVMYR